MFFLSQVHRVQQAIMVVIQIAIKPTAIGNGRGAHSFYFILTLRTEVHSSRGVLIERSKEVARYRSSPAESNRASDKAKAGKKQGQASGAVEVGRSM